MGFILSSLDVFLKSGLVFSILAMGYYVSYTVLDFPDLTVEGTFVTGAVTYGLLCHIGLNGWLALPIVCVVGSLFGCLTGILNVKLKIRDLLCGILVSTGLLTINIVLTSVGITGDFKGEQASTINLFNNPNTLHNSFPMKYIPAKLDLFSLRDILIFVIVVILVKLLLDLFFKTKRGMLLRATGDNKNFVTTLSKDAGNMKILGLAIGNACAALSGALYTTISGNVNQSMGLGTVVIGLASLIIGLSVFNKVSFMSPTTKVILGALIYQLTLTIAQKIGIPSSYNKLIMAILFTIALIFSEKLKKKVGLKHA